MIKINLQDFRFIFVATVISLIVVSVRSASVPNHEAIIGGRVARQGEFPFVAFLAGSSFFCGGTLIDSVTVLTAAHCIINDDGTDPKTTWLVYVDTLVPFKGVVRQVRRSAISVHHEYHPKAGIFTPDIAIMHLNPPIPGVLSNVMPATSFLSNSLVGRMGMAMGWGTTKLNGRASKVLKVVDVRIWSDDSCTIALGGSNNPKHELCAGGIEGQDACQGDSGGPLVLRDAENWVLVGIISWGESCANAGLPGVYADISSLTTWITATMKKLNELPNVEFPDYAGFIIPNPIHLASSNSELAPNAFDGNLNSIWLSNSWSEEYIQVDMGTVVRATNIWIWRRDQKRIRNAALYTSANVLYTLKKVTSFVIGPEQGDFRVKLNEFKWGRWWRLALEGSYANGFNIGIAEMLIETDVISSLVSWSSSETESFRYITDGAVNFEWLAHSASDEWFILRGNGSEQYGGMSLHRLEGRRIRKIIISISETEYGPWDKVAIFHIPNSDNSWFQGSFQKPFAAAMWRFYIESSHDVNTQIGLSECVLVPFLPPNSRGISGGLITYSSGSQASLALDNDPSTSWRSASPLDGWVVIDVGSGINERRFGALSLRRGHRNRVRNMILLATNNASIASRGCSNVKEWYSVTENLELPAVDGIYSTTFTSFQARYWCIYVFRSHTRFKHIGFSDVAICDTIKIGGNNLGCFTSFSMEGVPEHQGIVGSALGDIISNVGVIAWSSEMKPVHVALNVLTSSLSDFWLTEKPTDQWIIFEMHDLVTLTAVRIVPIQWKRLKRISVDIGGGDTDENVPAKKWNTVHSFRIPISRLIYEEKFPIPLSLIRFLRFVFHNTHTPGKYVGVKQIVFLGF